ncbi:MAG TPA: HAMP domain-containing sensor histidine kinase [Bacteroidetes bacterium]|nr:HAMP domain-containing sensor histidine kinase [Bacteroidota bacterium]
MTEPVPPTPLRRRRAAAFGWIALALAALIPLTFGVETAVVAQAGSETSARTVQRERAAEVQRRATALLGGLQREAEAVAALPSVHEALMDSADTVSGAAIDALLRRESDPFTSVEVYGPGRRLVAWRGGAFRLGVRAVPDTVVSLAVADGAGRRALAVWAPVVVEDSVVGAVRVVRLAQSTVPVRNRFLQDYDLADEWRAAIDGPFELLISGRRTPPVAGAAPLVGLGGRGVGWLRVPVPTRAALVASVEGRFRDVQAFWCVLLMGWLLAGGATLATHAVRRAVRENSRPAWRAASGAVAGFALALTATRFALLRLDVPVRWLGGGRETPPLFDPLILASDLGWGLLRSAGDLGLTALFALGIAAAVLALAVQYAAAEREEAHAPHGLSGAVLVALAGLVAAGAVTVLAAVVRSAVLDAPQLGFADRSGGVVDGLLVVALGSLLVASAVAAGLVASAVVLGGRAAPWARWGAVLAAFAGAGGAGAVAAGSPVVVALGVAALGVGGGLALQAGGERWGALLTFRGLLAAVFVLAPIAYGFMAYPLRERTDALLSDAARQFAEGRDQRVTYALDQVLSEARADDALRPALLDAVAVADSLRRGLPVTAFVPDTSATLDSTRQSLGDLAAGLVRSSLLGSLSDVAAELTFISPTGDTLGGFAEGGAPAAPPEDPLAFSALRDRYESRDEGGFFVASAPSREGGGLARYAGIGPLANDPDDPRAWIYVRATPRPSRFAAETPFPRVLAPADLFGLDDETITYAEYDDGVRARGGDEAPFRLPEDVVQLLEAGAGAARRPERADGETYQSYYVRVGDGTRDVVSARVPAGDPLDVLLVLLRLTLAGLAVGLGVYVTALPVRRRLGLFPAPRTRFRDKVLNRFLIVGLASVGLTGLVGQNVIQEQNEQAVRDLLRQRLGRVEAALGAEAPPGTPTGSLLEGVRPDALSAQLGFDLHLYRGADLLASSRRQLVTQRLIEPRLPAEVFHALYVEGRPFAFAASRIGTGDGGFAYTTGYKALPDSTGRPVGAAAVPTLPEQAAIEAGQARMLTYLFGGLLVLLVAIAAGAALLAGQLTRPFGRLQQGLRAVGEGRSEEPIPVETRDEVGELVETFNAMQQQLAESRRQLAEQERELAWREMARQVAHEIKNPLMPMKLSVQHLRRIFRVPGEEAPPEERKFAGAFERTTEMLVDQIESLSRIASEFSSFARLPLRNPEVLDLGEVAREAAALFESEALASATRATFHPDLAMDPLPITADREELRRAFVNLLTNAHQAMPPLDERDGRPGRIALRTRLAEAADGTPFAMAEVADTGTGVPEEAREKIFQPSFSTKSSGMGLGLAVVKRAVEAAGGSVGFVTETEGTATGTTFTLRFPLAVPADEPEPSGDGAATQPAADEPEPR